MNKYKFEIDAKGVVKLPSNLQIVFLCGVNFNDNPDDKRVALEAVLATRPNTKIIILERHFPKPYVYGFIGLRNLHDVETLVSCFANATIVIHESLSTAAEIGMLAANRSTAQRTAVLYPDVGSVEDNKISGFIQLAYYGKSSVLSSEGRVVFVPNLRNKYNSNYKQTVYTFLPEKFKESYPYERIEDFLDKPATKSIDHIEFHRLGYNRKPTESEDVIDYQYKNTKLTIHCSPEALRSTVISVLNIKEARIELENCHSYIEVISLLDKWLKNVFTETLSDSLPETTTQTTIELKNIRLTPFQNDENTSEYRKALGMLMYVFKAAGFLSVKDTKDDKSQFKLKQDFTKTRDAFAKTITLSKETAFARYIEAGHAE
jgi:hypothetical protein